MISFPIQRCKQIGHIRFIIDDLVCTKPSGNGSDPVRQIGTGPFSPSAVDSVHRTNMRKRWRMHESVSVESDVQMTQQIWIACPIHQRSRSMSQKSGEGSSGPSEISWVENHRVGCVRHLIVKVRRRANFEKRIQPFHISFLRWKSEVPDRVAVPSSRRSSKAY